MGVLPCAAQLALAVLAVLPLARAASAVPAALPLRTNANEPFEALTFRAEEEWKYFEVTATSDDQSIVRARRPAAPGPSSRLTSHPSHRVTAPSPPRCRHSCSRCGLSARPRPTLSACMLTIRG